MAHFFKGMSSLKVKEVPGYVRKYAGEHWTYSKIKQNANEGLLQYKEKYIDTGSGKPFTDVVIGLSIFAYLVAWPTEYKHMKAEQEAKLQGKTLPPT